MVEWAALEMRCARKGTVSSNLTSSVIQDFASGKTMPRGAKRAARLGCERAFLSKNEKDLSMKGKRNFFINFIKSK